MQFFERFRVELKRYADGVHELGAPADDQALARVEARLGRPLATAFRDFLAQWDGGYLFHDDYALWGASPSRPELDRLALVEGDVEIGASPSGSVRLDARGRVVTVDDATAERAVEGSDFARWLDAVMAREGLVYDRDGEFREEAFDGVELTAKVQRKRAEAAVKADPSSPAWREELGRLLVEAGSVEAAAEALQRAAELEPSSAGAWFELAKLRRQVGAHAPAAEAFRRAAEARREPEEAAFAFAQAARAAGEAGAIDLAVALGRRAVDQHPGFVDEQRAAADHLVGEGDLDGAIEKLALALAVAPSDDAVQQALARARARAQLKQV